MSVANENNHNSGGGNRYKASSRTHGTYGSIERVAIGDDFVLAASRADDIVEWPHRRRPEVVAKNEHGFQVRHVARADGKAWRVRQARHVGEWARRRCSRHTHVHNTP